MARLNALKAMDEDIIGGDAAVKPEINNRGLLFKAAIVAVVVVVVDTQPV